MTKAKKKPAPTPRGVCHIRVELEPGDRDLLRVRAAKAGMSMASYARALLVADVRKEPGQ